MPGVSDDDQVEQRQRHHDADAGALRDDCRRQGPQFVRKPFVGRMQRDRIGRTFAGAEHDTAGNQRREAHGADHGELRQRPDHPHHQQHPARLHMIADEADHDRGQREQQEEARAHQSELARGQLQLFHDGHSGETDDRLVGEIDQHEKEHQADDQPASRLDFVLVHVSSGL